MPSRDIHEIFSYLLTQLLPSGPTKGSAMHTAMDAASQWMGSAHRAINHDIMSIFNLSVQQAFQTALSGGNFWDSLMQNMLAGVSHVALDEAFSAAKRAIGTATPYDQSLADAKTALQRFLGNPPAT